MNFSAHFALHFALRTLRYWILPHLELTTAFPNEISRLWHHHTVSPASSIPYSPCIHKTPGIQSIARE
jgi:hypothetical protein